MIPYPVDLSKTLVSTPLVTKSLEYFINVQAIKVDGKPIHFNHSLLSIDNAGVGGTKLSTTKSFTVLHSSIYKALVREFATKAASKNIVRVASVAPFGACFSAKTIRRTRTGPCVPTIDLVWRVYGANSMVKAKKDVACLAFVDGGYKARTSLVLGGYQLEDNLVEFDLDSSERGFSSSLPWHKVTCSQKRLF